MTPEISELVRELRELNDLITDSRISDAGIGMRVRTWKEVATLADTIQRLSERTDERCERLRRTLEQHAVRLMGPRSPFWQCQVLPGAEPNPDRVQTQARMPDGCA